MTHPIQTFTQALANELGYSYQPQTEPMMADCWGEMMREDGLTIVCDGRVGVASKDKIEIRARMPASPVQGRSLGVRSPSIGVSINRSIPAVAADVRRRLLPLAEKALQEAKRTSDALIMTAYVERTACVKLGIKPDKFTNRGSRYFGAHGDVTVYEGGSVKIELRGIDVELAQAVIALVESHDARKANKAG